MRRSDRIIAAARGAVGVPFRLHGRDVASGLDCIGLVLHAMQGGGWQGRYRPPVGYTLRGGALARIEAGLRAAGLRRVRVGRGGDVVIVRAGPEQMHLMIALDGSEGHVHAHAGLGRVVSMPGPSPWPVLGRWRWGR